MPETVSAEELEEVVRRTNRPFSSGIGAYLERQGYRIFNQFPEMGADENGLPVLTYRVGSAHPDPETGLLLQAKVVVSIIKQG